MDLFGTNVVDMNEDGNNEEEQFYRHMLSQDSAMDHMIEQRKKDKAREENLAGFENYFGQLLALNNTGSANSQEGQRSDFAEGQRSDSTEGQQGEDNNRYSEAETQTDIYGNGDSGEGSTSKGDTDSASIGDASLADARFISDQIEKICRKYANPSFIQDRDFRRKTAWENFMMARDLMMGHVRYPAKKDVEYLCQGIGQMCSSRSFHDLARLFELYEQDKDFHDSIWGQFADNRERCFGQFMFEQALEYILCKSDSAQNGPNNFRPFCLNCARGYSTSSPKVLNLLAQYYIKPHNLIIQLDKALPRAFARNSNVENMALYNYMASNKGQCLFKNWLTQLLFKNGQPEPKKDEQ